MTIKNKMTRIKKKWQEREQHEKNVELWTSNKMILKIFLNYYICFYKILEGFKKFLEYFRRF